jgi:hypothetical protein
MAARKWHILECDAVPPSGAPEAGYVFATRDTSGVLCRPYGIRVAGKRPGVFAAPLVTDVPGYRVADVLVSLGVERSQADSVGRFVRTKEVAKSATPGVGGKGGAK